VGTISCGNITGRTGTTISAPTLLYGTTNVSAKISDIESSLFEKQASLTTSTDINIGSITCGNITGRTSTTTITSATITASTNLLIGTTNVGTKISSIETSLNSKQSTLIAGDNISIINDAISSTGGGTTIDSTAGGNLLFIDSSGTKNVKTEFSASNTAINNKQDKINFLTDLTCSTLSSSNLNVTGNSTVGPILNIGINDASSTPKTIYFGGLNGDNEYAAAVIKSLFFSGTETLELLNFKGNDVNQDRICIRAGIIHFDTNQTGNNDRTAENIRMTISAAGRVGIGKTNPLQPLDVIGNIYSTGNIVCTGYSFSSAKPRMRISRSNFTIPSGTTSLLNGGSVGLQSNCTVTAGIFIATIAGKYACSCKLRLPDNNNQSPEIQWYRRAGSGQQSAYEDLKDGFLLGSVVDGRV
jgi:hypothetical protein